MYRTFALPLALFALFAAGHAQQPSALHFDTVSVREGKSNADGSWTMSGPSEPNVPRLDLTNWTTLNLISFAFDMNDARQIDGLPRDLVMRYFVVHAQSGEETAALLKPMSPAAAWQAKQRMLQEVLTERFQLRYHFVTREVRSSILVAGKRPKLKLSAARPLVPGDERKEDPNDPTQPSGGYRCTSRGCTLTARCQSMAWLAEMIRGDIEGQTVERTGLSGLYDFTLTWMPSHATGMDGADAAPLLDVALAEQLGLKLEHGKATTKILVVDHIEAPTPN